MAFDDLPSIDKNSERSEESVHAVKGFLTRKTGFICREEFPDNGVDINVELISSQGATSNIFAIQVKSTQEVTIIQEAGINYVSIEFKTSRLGHLCRRPPAFGIVTIYDEEAKTTYFDYVEDIVKRITHLRGNEEWKQQEKVNIRLPLNKLDVTSVSVIHQWMTNRFEDHGMLVQAFGDLYRIPSFENKSTSKIDFNDPKEVEKLLKEQGLNLFDSKHYDMIIGLLESLPSNTIMRSKDLVLVASITFGQAGLIIESDYYMQRARLYESEYTTDEIFMLDFIRAINKFKKGEVSQLQLLETLKELKGKSKNILNILALEINLVYSRVLKNRGNASQNVLTAIKEIFVKIEGANIQKRDKTLLKLFNLENLHNYGTRLLLSDGEKFTLQRKMGIHIPMQQREKRAKSVIDILEAAVEETHKILRASIKEMDKLLMAFAAYYEARFFFSNRFHAMMVSFEEATAREKSFSDLYENNLNFCQDSAQMFVELSMFQEAHRSLCCAYDLKLLHRVLTNTDVGRNTIAEIETSVRKFEVGMGIKEYRSTVEDTYKSLSKKTPDSETSWATLADNQVESHARKILEAYELPENRLRNIIADINALRLFYRECTNPDLELLQDRSHHRSNVTRYATPPVFIIRSRKSGIQSKRSSDLGQLLEQFSTIIKKK